MAWLSQTLGMGANILATIGSARSAKKAGKELDRIGSLDPNYTQSGFAQDTLDSAKMNLNSRMAGAGQAQNNIFANQANTVAGFNRNATDASQLLSLNAAAQGQTNNAFNQLGAQEAQDKQQKIQAVAAANAGMTEEHTKSFDDKVRQWQDQLGIAMKKNEMKQQSWKNLGELGGAMSGAGTLGFGKGNSGGPNPYPGYGGWD